MAQLLQVLTRYDVRRWNQWHIFPTIDVLSPTSELWINLPNWLSVAERDFLKTVHIQRGNWLFPMQLWQGKGFLQTYCNPGPKWPICLIGSFMPQLTTMFIPRAMMVEYIYIPVCEIGSRFCTNFMKQLQALFKHFNILFDVSKNACMI